MTTPGVDGLPKAPRLRKAERVTPFMGMIEIPRKIRKVLRPGLALIGDAGLVVDPFQSAEWLAEAVGNSFQRPDTLDRGLGMSS
ncbi:MAG: hypothetical protein M3Z96_05645 [Pseudomonadota bacterium]|nr:hypothetical protein [Pseudomonadota bacterium]